MRHCCGTLVLGLSLVSVTGAQQAADSRACLTGQVVGPDGEALDGATLKLRRQETTRDMTATTDAAGRFSYASCSPGWYELTAWQPGYATMAYGAAEPGGAATPLVLGGAPLSGLRVRLVNSGVVTGSVRKADGEPLGGVTVSVVGEVIGSSGLRYSTRLASGLTNAAGAYRLPDVPPGRYLLQAAPPGAAISSASNLEGYAITYYPSVPRPAEAARLDVVSGRTIEHIDVLVRTEPLVRMTGQVIGVGGAPLAGGTVTIDSAEPPFSMVMTSPIAQGRYSFPALRPGQYVLRFSEPAGAEEPMRASAVVDLTGTIDTVERDLLVQPASSVTGSLSIAAADSISSAAALRLSLLPRDERLHNTAIAVAVRADGSFAFDGLPPGQYRFTVTATSGPSPVRLSSARVNDQETVDGFFEVGRGGIARAVLTVTDRQGLISGSLSDAADAPATGYTVVVFPADRALWPALFRRSFGVRPANTGDFRIPNVPPGEYRLAVVQNARKNEWLLPEFLETVITASTPVSVAENTPTSPIRLVVRHPGTPEPRNPGTYMVISLSRL